MNKSEGARFIIVIGGICILYLALIVRLFYWQVVRAEGLRDQGRLQSSETIDIPAIRGKILSADNFPLAANTISYTLYSNPKVISNKEDYAEKISKVLEADTASISALLSKDLFWVKLGQNIGPKMKEEIEKLDLDGIGFEQDYERFYPEASMAAHLIGFLGRNDEGRHHGYFGVEGEYNDQLAGRSGALYALKDALGNQIVNDIREEGKVDGRNVKLTVDRTVQFIAERALKTGIDKYGAEGGSVLIMEPSTGKILAMSSFPRFDPKKYYEYESSTYTNPALSSLYEPGSTFKVLVMASAVDMNLVRPETKCDICAGPVQIGEYKIRTWNNEYTNNQTMRDTIIQEWSLWVESLVLII